MNKISQLSNSDKNRKIGKTPQMLVSNKVLRLILLENKKGTKDNKIQ